MTDLEPIAVAYRDAYRAEIERNHPYSTRNILKQAHMQGLAAASVATLKAIREPSAGAAQAGCNAACATDQIFTDEQWMAKQFAAMIDHLLQEAGDAASSGRRPVA